MTGETIAALATPPGKGGVAIVRISGGDAAAIATAIVGELPPARYAAHCIFRDAADEIIDDGLVLYFPAPHSFTGETVVEFQGHGGPVVVDRLLARIYSLGARPARPGEFSERAFLNGRIDLVQAEAIADLIDSGSVAASRAARRSLEGEFSRRIERLVDSLVRLRVAVEATIDFADEALDGIGDAACGQQITALRVALERLEAEAHQGSLLHEGMTVVISGPPNAGKSSLLNRLARHDRAIVSPIAGTTRDVLRETITLDGLPLHIVDTAGLRDSDDPVERLGIERANTAIATADRILFVCDASESPIEVMALLPEVIDPARLTRIVNKIDLTDRPATIESAKDGSTTIALSALSGEGIDLLIDHLKDVVGYRDGEGGVFSARRRHLEALARTAAILDRAADLSAEQDGELLAEELRLAQQTLGEITGEVTADDLLGEIFSSFCIGK